MVTTDDVVYGYGRRAIENMRNRNGNAMNLFGQMLAACENNEKVSLTDKDIREEAGNLIVAGSDTTAVTLTYLVWAVLKQPDLQARLEDEIAGDEGNDQDGKDQDDGNSDTILSDREHRLVRLIGRFELSGLAIKHPTPAR